MQKNFGKSPEEEKKARIIRLNEIQKEICLKKNTSQIGQVQEVLIEEVRTKRSEDEMQARNDYNTIVIIPKSAVKVGEYVKVKIEEATPNVLKGSYIN